MLRNFGKNNLSELNGNFRLKNIPIDSQNNVDIDITFIEKTDKITYSTDMALYDRLNTIKKIDPLKYKYVIANILLAKEVLKNIEYSTTSYEILSDTGIENWILQNGGSFITASENFIEASEGKSFEEFISSYQIWDFGDNYSMIESEQFLHGNFIVENMSEDGYNSMIKILKEYLDKINSTFIFKKI